MNPRVAEIFVRLDAIELAEGKLRTERAMLHAELQETLEPRKRKRTPPPIELAFGKNIITWDRGAVALEGVSYKIVKALYDANGMKMKEGTLGRLAWGNEPAHKNFTERIRRVSEQLEIAKFPYRMLSVMSKEKTILTGEKYPDGRPKFKHIRPVIIGVKLTATSKSAKVAADF